MKNKFSLILFTALLSTTFAWAQDASFYNLPKGAFGCGMTSTGVMPVPYIVAPYFPDESPVWKSATGEGDWFINNTETPAVTANEYTMPVSMNGKYNIPMLVQDGKKKFQFGIKSAETYRTDTYFYVGDSLTRYITPALMYTDLVTSSSGAANAIIANYKTTSRDVMGVYFNNIDVMYITGISIPIKNNDAADVNGMLPTDDAHVIVNIYKATDIGGKTKNKADKTTPLWTGTLTKGDFKVSSSKNVGALTKTFDKAISIKGPFVVELSDMQKSGCKFNIISSQVHGSANYWGYYINDEGVETYPNPYILAVSVSAMFPALYLKDGESPDVIIPSIGASLEQGNCPERTVYANRKYKYKANGWEANTATSGMGIGADYNESTNEWVKWLYSMDPNNTDKVREGFVIHKFRGKELKIHLTQAPMITQINLQGMLSLKKDNTYQLGVSVFPATADLKEITWSSNKEDVVTVDETGKVTAHSHGKATITATFNNDIKATCEVTVFGVVPVEDPTTTTITAPAAGGETTTVSFTLAAGLSFDETNWSVNVTERPDWITSANFTSSQTDPKGPTTVTCTLTAAANATGSKREGKITITAFTDKFEYTITQESLPSAFYEVPEGAFFAGMTNKGAMAYGAIYLPYKKEGSLIFSSVDGAGNWWSNGSEQKKNQTDYTYSNLSMNSKKTIPQLRQEGKVNYQYGGSGVDYDKDHLFFYVGNSDMQYMTPAKLWCDLTQKANGQAQTLVNTFYTNNYDVMGVYFDNKDVMYIDGISIPISADLTEKTITQMLPADKHVTVKIYHATINDEGKSFDRNSEPIWKGNLKQNAFTPYDNTHTYRGALNATFEEPISINGPFVVELSEMSGCNFYVYSAKERPGCNKWGYYLKDNKETYPDPYTPAISVHAMFPALYTEESLDVEIPAEGTSIDDPNCPTRTVYANCKYETNKNGWSRTASELGVITMNYKSAEQTDKSTKWYFTMGANTTGEERKVDVTFTFRGKTLTYHVTQAAPEPDFTLPNKAAGAYATICLPKKIDHVENATLFSITDGDIMKVNFEEVTEFEAGMPYLVQATADGDVNFYYAEAGDAVETPVTPEEANGFVGWLQEEPTYVPDNGYCLLVSGGKLYIAAENCHLTKNHAYIDVNKVPASPNKAPNMAARRVTLYNAEAQVPTNLNGLNGIVKPMKVLRDGQLYIIRDTKTYNAQGIELQ